MKRAVLVAVVMAGIGLSCIGQATASDEGVALAPRSARLTGSAYRGSKKGLYVITFPSPNECVTLGHVRAGSRATALYKAFSKGGFSLQELDSALTVWTAEEWDDFVKSAPDFIAEMRHHCTVWQLIAH
jgi:hypothetical protein